jgi:hypothetical protein
MAVKLKDVGVLNKHLRERVQFWFYYLITAAYGVPECNKIMI